MNPLYLLTLLTAALPTALAADADVCAYPAADCPNSSGTGVCCMDIFPDDCCNMATSVGKSAAWFNMPSMPYGIGYSYSDWSCSGTSLGGVGPPGGCKTFGSTWARSVKWSFNPRGKRSLGGGKNVEPNAVRLKDPVTGEMRFVAIPEGRSEEVTSWVVKGEVKKLAGLKNYVRKEKVEAQ
ncbi:hypothetical protein EDC01DRAFT_651980 [Geopyxis carbonaria]|nr:hypothetical protein EDC01DRAFT_651980 [Geopyxis carbonaria]